MRDDIDKLNLPRSAKLYARRKGLATLGPKGVRQFLAVNKKLINPTRPSTMKSVDAVGPVKHASHGLKESSESATSRILGESDSSDEFGPEDQQQPIDWSKAKFIRKGQIPAGAKRVHMYPVQNILKPRGSLAKESLSADLVERLESAFQSWTDTQFGDSLPPEKVLSVLKQNLDQEVQAAWNAFMDR